MATTTLSLADDAIDLLTRVDELVGVDDESVSRARRIREQAERDVAVVVTFGAYSSGKTTLLSSILKIPLPAAPSPTTATLVRFRWGPRPTGILRFARTRVIGPLSGLGPAATTGTLNAVAEVLRVPRLCGMTVRAAASPIDRAGQPMTLLQIERAASDGEAPEYLRLEFPAARPAEVLDLADEQDALKKWVAGPGVSLWIDEVVIELPDERLRRLELVDTPGVDSPVLGHRLATEEAVRSASVVLFFVKAEHPDVHRDHREARRHLMEHIEARATMVVNVATWADEGIERIRDDEFEEGGAALSINQARAALARSLGKGLRAAMGDRAADEPVPDVHVVDARDPADPAIPALLGALEKAVDRSAGPPRQQAARRALLHVLIPRKAALEGALRSVEARSQRMGSRNARLARAEAIQDSLGARLKAVQDHLARALPEIRERAENHAKRALTDLQSCTEIAEQWQMRANKLSDEIQRRLEHLLEEVADEASDSLDQEITPPRVPQPERTGTSLDASTIEKELRGVLPLLAKGGDVLLPLRMSQRFLGKARVKAVDEIRRAASRLETHERDRIDETAKLAESLLDPINHLADTLRDQDEGSVLQGIDDPAGDDIAALLDTMADLRECLETEGETGAALLGQSCQ